MGPLHKSENYKNINIDITYSPEPHSSHEHNHHAMQDGLSKNVDYVFLKPPKIEIDLKGRVMDIGKEFHLMKTMDEHYYTHYFPYEDFKSPWDLAFKIIDSLLVKDDISNSMSKR